jgi:hypothetical protein
MANHQLSKSRFEKVLEDFKQKLSWQEKQDFKFTSLRDLQRTIVDIQNEQASSNRMKNFHRLSGFLEAMEQFEDVIKIFANSSEFVAFVWVRSVDIQRYQPG